MSFKKIEEGFSERFKSLKKPGETQAEFGKRLGLAQSVVNMYLNGKGSPSVANLTAIAEQTGTTLHWLATGEGEKYDSPEYQAQVRRLGLKAERGMNDQDRVDMALLNIRDLADLDKEHRDMLAELLSRAHDNPDLIVVLLNALDALERRGYKSHKK